MPPLMNDDQHRQCNDGDKDFEKHAIHDPSITLRKHPSRQRARATTEAEIRLVRLDPYIWLTNDPVRSKKWLIL
jgi:hypothetical protein